MEVSSKKITPPFFAMFFISSIFIQCLPYVSSIGVNYGTLDNNAQPPPHTQPQPKSQPPPHTQPQPKPQPPPHTQPQAQPQPKPQPPPHTQPQAQPQPKPQPPPHTQPQPKPQPPPHTQPQAQAQPKPQPPPHTQPQAQAQPPPQPQPQPKPQAPPHTQPGPKNPSVSVVKNFCMPKGQATDAELQANLDWVCTNQGVDCRPIQVGGPCFNPSTVRAHAGYAMNAYYQIKGKNAWNCDFRGTGTIVHVDPSYGLCQYPF